MVTFFEMGVTRRLGNSNQLMRLSQLIDWKGVRSRLKGLYKMEENDQGGQRPYDPLKMFKAILLGQWHNLSDPQLEDSLRVRLDFMLFTGFEMDQGFPDETTLCRFRNKLIEKRLHRKLFRFINRQLEELGLQIETAPCAVVDATIIESSARPKRVYEVEEDREESEEPKKTCVRKVESKDPDARWLKKGKRCFFGYKGFVSAAAGTGFIQTIALESANISEVGYFEHFLKGLTQKEIYGDKGYTSQKNNLLLKDSGKKNRIMRKAKRDHALSFWEKKFNKLISKKRYIIEQAFGTLKRRFQMSRASYMTRLKVEAQLYLKSICFNLLKAVRMCQI